MWKKLDRKINKNSVTHKSLHRSSSHINHYSIPDHPHPWAGSLHSCFRRRLERPSFLAWLAAEKTKVIIDNSQLRPFRVSTYLVCLGGGLLAHVLLRVTGLLHGGLLYLLNVLRLLLDRSRR